jgi:hypothetical protein
MPASTINIDYLRFSSVNTGFGSLRTDMPMFDAVRKNIFCQYGPATEGCGDSLAPAPGLITCLLGFANDTARLEEEIDDGVDEFRINFATRVLNQKGDKVFSNPRVNFTNS